MKYIPGFKFTPQAIKRGGSILEQQQKNKKLLRDKTFKAGSEYEIHHIVPTKNNVNYFFLVDGAVQQITFNSIKEAEKKISKFVGEE